MVIINLTLINVLRDMRSTNHVFDKSGRSSIRMGWSSVPCAYAVSRLCVVASLTVVDVRLAP